MQPEPSPGTPGGPTPLSAGAPGRHHKYRLRFRKAGDRRSSIITT